MLWGVNDPEAEGNRRSSTTLRSHPATALFGSVALSFVIPSSRLAEASRERNDKARALCNIEGRNRRVPQVSLLRPGIPQTNSHWEYSPSSLSSRAQSRDLQFRGPFLEMFFDSASLTIVIPSSRLAEASRERNDTAKIAIDVRPGGPTAKRQPSPEGLGNRSRRGSERRRRGTKPIVRSPCVIRSVAQRSRGICVGMNVG
jgi:hypothetical protein